MRFEFGVVPYIHWGVRRFTNGKGWKTVSAWCGNREDLEPVIAEMEKAGAIYKVVKRTSFYETERAEAKNADDLAEAEAENAKLRKFVTLLLGGEEETGVSQNGGETVAGEGDHKG